MNECTTIHHIRLSTPHDAPVLANIWRRAVRATHDFLSEADFSDIENIVANEYLPNTVVYTAVDIQDVPLGFMGVTGNHIDTLFIDPDFHRRGIGRIMVDYIASLCAADILVEVNEQNPKAIAFYQENGFVIIGRSENDPDGRPYPVLHLIRKYQ